MRLRNAFEQWKGVVVRHLVPQCAFSLSTRSTFLILGISRRSKCFHDALALDPLIGRKAELENRYEMTLYLAYARQVSCCPSSVEDEATRGLAALSLPLSFCSTSYQLGTIHPTAIHVHQLCHRAQFHFRRFYSMTTLL